MTHKTIEGDRAPEPMWATPSCSDPRPARPLSTKAVRALRPRVLSIVSTPEEQGTRCKTCKLIGSPMGDHCRSRHPDRCAHTRADGTRCRTVGRCAVHEGTRKPAKPRKAVRKMAGTLWTPREERHLFALRRADTSWADIAAALGRTVNAVRVHHSQARNQGHPVAGVRRG